MGEVFSFFQIVWQLRFQLDAYKSAGCLDSELPRFNHVIRFTLEQKWIPTVL